MTNSGSASGELTAEEQRLLSSFWSYCQPVDLYCVLANRFDNKDACSRPLPPPASGLAINLSSACVSSPLSVIAALCEEPADNEFVPLSATLLHVQAAEGAEQSAAVLAMTPGLLHHLLDKGYSRRLTLVLLLRDDFRDVRWLKRQGARLTCTLDRFPAFGLLPAPCPVSWAAVPLTGRPVTLRPAQLTMRYTAPAKPGSSEPPTAIRLQPSCTAVQLQAPPVNLRVTLTLPSKVDLLDTAALQSPPERTVHWRFFYAKGQRHAVEAMKGNRCALCQMMCMSFTGLKLHLEACHDRFVYGFCEDHPDVAPAIHVACAEELQFVQQETGQGNLQSAIVQAFFHWVPCSQRRRRVAIYQARTGKALGLKDRHLLAHQSVLVEQRSTDRPSSTEVAPELAKAQQKPAKAAVRRPPKQQPPPVPMPRRPTFFHSRNCEAVTPAEIDIDSDDEVDQEEWARRARQKLLECTDLGRTEKEFVLNWNSAVHADPIHSDAYTAQACSHFAKEHAEVLATVPTVRALFVEHLAMQWDFGVMSSEEVDACLLQVQQKANELRGWQPPQDGDASASEPDAAQDS